MRRERSLHRLTTAAFIALAGLALAACEQMADIIPDSKKPLPGERKLLFPEGVPGVSQGVPPELIRNNQQAQGQPGAPAAAQAQPPQQQVEEKPKPKPKVQRAARQQPAQEQAEPAQQQQQQQQSSPWPAAPQQQQPAQASPWPSSPAPGTFTR